MEVNGLGFESAIGLFPGFLKHSASAGVFAEVIDKIDSGQVSIRGEPFVNMVVQQNGVVRIFKFYFVNHGLRILLSGRGLKAGRLLYNYGLFGDKVLSGPAPLKVLDYFRGSEYSLVFKNSQIPAPNNA